PYGIYDIGANAGWVNVGTDRDTAAFAVESVRRWWSARGRLDYPAARRVLITADAGGSNGYRTRASKTGLAALAAETGLEIPCTPRQLPPRQPPPRPPRPHPRPAGPPGPARTWPGSPTPPSPACPAPPWTP